jgi:hypothetical protein
MDFRSECGDCREWVPSKNLVALLLIFWDLTHGLLLSLLVYVRAIWGRYDLVGIWPRNSTRVNYIKSFVMLAGS